MEDIFKCEICETKFKHKSSLTNHMKKAKYCLNIRNNVVKITPEFICEYCDTEFHP